MNEEEQKKFDELLQGYRSEISNRRILLKPLFQDFDRGNLGHISKNQFLRILYQHHIMPSKDYVNLLLKKYTDKGNLDEVNYYDFCRDVDLYEDDAKEISKTHADAFKVTRPKHQNLTPDTITNDKPEDLEDLFTKIRRKIKQQRIRVSEFLRDFDKLRCGGITNYQFRLGMNMAGLPLSNHEYQLIIENFPHQKDNHVRWRDICDKIEEVFTTKSLEKAPMTQVF